MLTLLQEYPHYCPICGEAHSDHLPIFECGHLIDSYYLDAENQAVVEEWYSSMDYKQIPLEFLEGSGQAKIIDKNRLAWYFAENPTLIILQKAVAHLVEEKNGLSYEIISHKTDWENSKGSLTAKIMLNSNGSFWWGTLSVGKE